MAIDDAYAKLIDQVQADGLWVRDLLHNTATQLEGMPTADDPDAPADPSDPAAAAMLPQMELQPFEHYDYIMLLFRNDQDFQRACEVLGIQKVQIDYPGGLTKIGLGRCLDGAKAIDRLAQGDRG